MSSVSSARCCTPGPAVEVQVLVDLALLAARRRLVDGELDGERAVGHHDGHQGAVLGGDVLVVEADVAREAEHAAVPVRPVVHPAEFDVAHHVVDAEQPGVASRRVLRRVARQERAAVVLVGHQRVDRVPVGRDRRMTDGAVLVRPVRRLADGLRAPRHRFGEGRVGVVHVEADVAHAVAVEADVIVDRIVRPVGGGQDDAGLALLEGVGRRVAPARFEARVRELREPEGLPVVVGRLPGVAHPELDVMDALQPQRIVSHGLCRGVPSGQVRTLGRRGQDPRDVALYSLEPTVQ